jgi:hypothetical protein
LRVSRSHILPIADPPTANPPGPPRAGTGAFAGRKPIHDAGHFAHVIMAAGLLAMRAGLHGEDRRLLVLAGLVHDLDHLGRRASSGYCRQERLSAQRAVRVIVGCGADARLALRINSLLRATALTNDVNRSTILGSDRLARLLTDADIFASVVYPRQRSMGMTRALKLEHCLAGSVTTLNRTDGLPT